MRYVAGGGICGLAWAAALRSWMTDLAGATSDISWLTFALVLLPGMAIGCLLGYAARLRRERRRPPKLLVFTPVLFAAALLDPTIARSLVTDGQGGGALLVVFTALAGGHALSGRTWSPARVGTVVVAVGGVGAMGAIALLAAPLTSARGLFIGVLGSSLMAVLCLASALPYSSSHPSDR